MIKNVLAMLRRVISKASRNVKMFKRIFVISVLSLVWYYSLLNLTACACVLFLLYTVSGGWKTLRMLYNTLPRDARAAVKLLTVKYRMSRIRKQNLTVPLLFRSFVEKHPDKVMFICADKKYTFRDVDIFSNQIGQYFQQKGFQYGDVIDLMMESRPEFVIIWLGLAKIGCITALINTNLRNQSLVHCIKTAQPKAVIVGSEYVEVVDVIRNELSDDYSYYYSGPQLDENRQPNCMTYLDEDIAKCQSNAPVVPSQAKPTDNLIYIYTSGTTGLPKAAVISHFRFAYLLHISSGLWGVRKTDVFYVPLPIYHSSGGILGVGQALINGCTVVIRPKFSASRYWSDCAKYNCTVGQYIGEICRYLLAQPESQHDRQHQVRLMVGNGLRPHIWEEFVKRFGIGKVGEFYGATEGNCSVMNTDNKVGAVGFMTQIIPALYPIMLIKVNPDSGEIQRDSNGLCIQCEAYEIGHLVGKIQESDPGRRFDGYLDRAASEKKIVRNVLRKGDSAFLSGDLLERDENGYLYFRDRTGDTFRWKGENVSTTEVEAVLMPLFGNSDVVVFGVQVPGFEGTAGMAAIAVDLPSSQEFRQLYAEMRVALPAYAMPIFIRIMSSAHAHSTGTFKLKKFDLQREGYNPSQVNDPLFLIDNQNKTYAPLDALTYKQSGLIDGSIRI
ncbi:long-chain fatty acid transport protein 1-like isoform X2 [Symsagittifera roscoffensis]|uniref:long-chain fatty acid transport protein 1-like isoform X2 n=1 Tax=Symsagittifera roscoffensis TaxID=84072 RepID=UPI00307B3C0D